MCPRVPCRLQNLDILGLKDFTTGGINGIIEISEISGIRG